MEKMQANGREEEKKEAPKPKEEEKKEATKEEEKAVPVMRG